VDSKNTSNILQKGLEGLKKDIQDNLSSNDRNASGKTSRSLRVSVSANKDRVIGILYGDEQTLEVLEFGRPPSKNGTKGKRTWEVDLRKWMTYRGIPQSAFYPIWRKINRDGFKGTQGLVSQPMAKFKRTIGEQVKLQIVKELRKNGINGNQ